MHRQSITSLTPELIAEVRESWAAYAHAKLSKCLSEADQPPSGGELAAWPKLVELSTSKPEWRQECLKRDEKADLYFATLVGHPLLYYKIFINLS